MYNARSQYRSEVDCRPVMPLLTAICLASGNGRGHATLLADRINARRALLPPAPPAPHPRRAATRWRRRRVIGGTRRAAHF